MQSNPDKTTMNVSLTTDTKDRIKAYAKEQRCTVSQAITQWIWSVQLRAEKEGKDDKAE